MHNQTCVKQAPKGSCLLKAGACFTLEVLLWDVRFWPFKTDLLELQIRGYIEDNSKITFLISQ